MYLDQSFYTRSNVVLIAKELLGKILFTRIGGKTTGGIIVETEAYSHTERGSHAYLSKMTNRNAVMFRDGGYAYVYLCYGIHNMFNVVTNVDGEADAVLIRALEPTEGLPLMMRRMGAKNERRITSGPGKLAKAMGIDRKMNGHELWSSQLWMEEGIIVKPSHIMRSERIGIDYAGKDALLPWRFTIKNNLWVSK